MGDRVIIHEVGPRDGLQNEPRLVSTADKVRLVTALAECGLRRIEVASFVDPARVPQMADGAAVLAGIPRRAGVRYLALVPNLRGFQAARQAQADAVAVFASASEGFSQRNINCSVAESLARFAPVMAAAREVGMAVRGYVSCVTDCPYDGPIPAKRTAQVAAALANLGCHEISLGDTLGAATPERVSVMLRAVLERVPAPRLAGHFHDTQSRALDNIETCLEAGVRVFDASVGGLGGCPFAPGAAGNVATEAVVARMHSLGIATGVDATALARAAVFARSLRTA